MKSLLGTVQPPCWLMLGSGIILSFLYIYTHYLYNYIYTLCIYIYIIYIVGMIIIQERGRDRSSHWINGDHWCRSSGVAPVLGAHGFLAVLPAQDAGAWTSHRPLAFSEKMGS